MQKLRLWRKLRGYFAAVFIFGAIVGAIGFGDLSSEIAPRHSNDKQECPTAAPQQDVDSGDARPESINDKKTNPRQEKSNRQENKWRLYFWDHITDWLVATFTGLLVYVTHRLKVSTDKLWKAGERALEATERAFISVDPGGIENFFLPDNRTEPPIGLIKIVNSGNLPARGVRWAFDAAIQENTLYENFPPPTGIIDSTNILVPKAQMLRFHKMPDWDITQMQSFQKGEMVLYVWGIVHYVDGFGKARFTKFCHRYEKDCISKKRAGILIYERARQHQYGNGTDEDS